VATEEDRQRRVDPGELDVQQTVEQLALARAAVAGELAACEVHLRQRRHDLRRELGPFPVLGDDRRDVRLEVVADVGEKRLLVVREQGEQVVEVTPVRGDR
jgi:hypothetical protein